MAKIMNLILLISLLLAISMAEGRTLFGKKKISSVVDCEDIYGVQAGDTCSGIVQEFSLTAEFFSDINPNLNCDNLFVGEWVCTSGSVS
ncbi:hypothetical protein FRX31_010826 [Thalictrum thalictroides]|uniref:LysM domain-containing protein n=1 Tax=Thalictrum thalictroides TaxID=46969 RepID=A0A7J6WRQ5_THATH|nr:hypothetical protein FRX31_010826 [Thalictrum thalictroides]